MNKPLEILDLSGKNKVRKFPGLNERLPKPPFFWSISAPRGAGKTNLMLNLFRKDFYRKVFRNEDIVLISPSIGLDKTIDALPAAHKFSNYDPEIIENILSEQKKISEIQGREAVPNILLILDDCISEGMFNRGGLLELLGYRGRHYQVSVIFSTQKYSALSRGIRNNCVYSTFFAPANLSEMDHIVEEHSDKTRRNSFINMFEYCTDEPYGFIHIDCKAKKDKKYQRNFKEYLDLSKF